MKVSNNKIKDIKATLKNEPQELLNKPWLLVYIPMIVISFFMNKLSIKTDRVYLVETSVERYLKENSKILKNINHCGFHLENYKSFEDFSHCLTLRLSDDPSSGKAYSYAIKGRFVNNSEAFVVFKDDTPIGYVFVEIINTKISQVNYLIKLPSYYFSFIDLYIYKQYRGAGYHEILYTMTIDYLSRKGYRHFICWLMEHNQISIKAHSRIGISRITKIITRRSFFFCSFLRTELIDMSLSDLIKS